MVTQHIVGQEVHAYYVEARMPLFFVESIHNDN